MRLRPRQKTFVVRSFAALGARGNTLGAAPTGAGKSVMLSAVTGEMIAGSMGSDDRMQYTVVGDSVNMAARLCENAAAGQVWFSQEVLQERDIRQRIEVIAEGALTLKGKTRETLCYRLDKLQSPFDQLLHRQMQHLLAQLEGNG